MSQINLEKYGITGSTEIVYNPSYEVLFEEETKAGLEGYEVGQLVIVDFNDNNTPDNIYDDLIVNVHRLVDIKNINE